MCCYVSQHIIINQAFTLDQKMNCSLFFSANPNQTVAFKFMNGRLSLHSRSWLPKVGPVNKFWPDKGYLSWLWKRRGV